MKGHEVLNEALIPLRAYFEAGSIGKGDIDTIRKALDDIPFFSAFMHSEKVQSIQRVTINRRLFNGENRRIENIDWLKYPPKEIITRYGRLNNPQQSVLYATFDPITALSEMRPEKGDLITMSTWRLASDHSLSISPVFKNTSINGQIHSERSLRTGIKYRTFLRQHEPDTALQIDLLIQFMADAFAKTVDSANDLDYFIGAYFANKIFYDFANAEVDAIIYPSVRQSLTLSNIAIKPEVFDANYIFAEAEESTVQNTPEIKGGWSLMGTGSSTEIKGSTITWK